MEDLRKSLELDPSSSLARMNLGTCLFKHGELEAALASFERALADAPPNWPVRQDCERHLNQARQALAGRQVAPP